MITLYKPGSSPNVPTQPCILLTHQVLTSISDNVMTYLEIRRQRMDVARIMKMNKSLASFMDSHQDDREPTPPENPIDKSQSSPASSEQNSRRSSTDKSSEDELPPGNGGRDYNQIFSRASTLLKQSLSLFEGGGGVLFFDTAPISSGRSSSGHRPSVA